uniref:Uncharacterized protein n=1 Tax=Glossina palpalis gambiensis TaxID=67801 RepID=A0A1B0BMS0_9MUSC
MNECTSIAVWARMMFMNKNNFPTYCQVKLPVIPSLRRSRNERCLLGPEPLNCGSIGFSSLPFSGTVVIFVTDVDKATLSLVLLVFTLPVVAVAPCSIIDGDWNMFSTCRCIVNK